MSLSEEEIRMLFRVNKTLSQMLKDRGYIVTDSELEMTQEQFIEKYGVNMERKDLDTIKTKKNNETDKIFVFFLQETKMCHIKPCFERMVSHNVFKAIIVVRKDMNRFAASAVTDANSKQKLYLESFKETELLMNVKEHAFVPEHIALTTEEKEALLEKYTVKENQLPRIQYTDPIAKYYGLKRGEVVKIIRKSETSGRYVTYRYVI
ncbi:DNA-directed RNA polymerases II and IV subunit 5A [Raphanus sativus]|uniref:DNA-directed RNA polymerases II and IV subunit 5A n=1 Tax=Raphanus sativus TaxID=3726 RepID=A0A6J0MT42_RAPSA|nr:DNA-directed RNA polymerases II and IV subunit 5A [Raphanus sativus]XP_056861287.1 DNA-directed RNA polymerases II and IV subunit 5A [Raphanus sativus]KAJ4908220.1 DNA-directed RNA polymerases II and IV subunit 5A [Raphanus sativus]